jgi:hypothetical protein
VTRPSLRRAALLVAAVLVIGGATACSSDDGGGGGDDGGDDAPTTVAPVLDRIDGPAQVDPSFDPSGSGRDPAAPATTDPG